MFINISEEPVFDCIGNRYGIFDFVIIPHIGEFIYSVLIGCHKANEKYTLFVIQIYIDGTLGRIIRISDPKFALGMYSQVIRNSQLLKARMSVINNWSSIKDLLSGR